MTTTATTPTATTAARPAAGEDERTGLPCYGGAGSDEVAVAPWPLLLRRRITRRVERSSRSEWWVLWTVLGGLFSVNVTITILAVAMPRMAADFHTTQNTMTWAVTAPLLAFGVAAPAMGKAGDIWGHRRIFVAGMAGAAICAVLTALAWDTGSLIAVRALGGVDNAATGAASMAIIFALFPPDQRVRAMGYWSLVGAGGPVLGVVLGAPVVEHVGWRWIFVGQVPLTVAGLVAAVLVLRETQRDGSQRFDAAGAVTLMVAVTSVLFALNRGPDWGWTNPVVVGAFVLCPAFTAAFVWVERRAGSPVLPLPYLRRRNFAFPIANQVFANFAYMGGFILAPLLLRQVFGYDYDRIGLTVIARPLTFAVAAPLGGYLALRVGERTAAVAGTALVAGSMLVFASLDRSSVVSLIVLALGLSGLGLGLSSPSVAALVANAVDDGDLGIASASQQLLTQVGLVAGIQLMETIQYSRTAAVGIVSAFHEAYLVGAVVCVLGVVAGAFVRSTTARPRPAP